jgi:hypothetical protein
VTEFLGLKARKFSGLAGRALRAALTRVRWPDFTLLTKLATIYGDHPPFVSFFVYRSSLGERVCCPAAEGGEANFFKFLRLRNKLAGAAVS